MQPFRIAALAAVLVVPAASAAAQQPAAPRKGPPTALVERGPAEGHRAPDFSLPWANRDGVGPAEQPFQLASTKGRTVVLAFYPRDFTSGCTAQMQTFAEQFEEMFGPETEVVGISVDPVETHVRFAQKLALPFRLLSDPSQEVAKRYGADDLSAGHTRRAVYVIGPDGRVVWRELRFGATDPRAYSALRRAVRDASRQG